MADNEIDKLRLHRLLFFSDAVLAIILTILVLDLRMPELSNADSFPEMLSKLGQMGPHFISFFLSFLVVWQTWQAYNGFFSLIVKYDNIFAAYAILMLLSVVMLPFISTLIGNYPYNPGSFVLFGGALLFGNIVLNFMLRYVRRKKMFTDAIDPVIIGKKMPRQVFYSGFILLAGIGLAFINTILSMIFYFLLECFWIYMFRYFKVTKDEISADA